MAAISVCGSSAKLVSASASSTTARVAGERGEHQIPHLRARPRLPAPAPRRCDGDRAGTRQARAPRRPARTITARLAAALTASASRGLAMVTRPAPARNAPRAASRAAPVEEIPPDTTTAWPREYLCPSTRGTGKLRRQSAGALSDARGLIRSSTSAGMPMSATWMLPQCSRPGSSSVADLAAEERDGFGGLDRDAHHRAGRAVDTARQVDRDDRNRLPRSSPRSWRARRPSTGRSRPAPNNASTTTSAGVSNAGAAGSERPCPALSGQRRVALEPAKLADQQHAHAIAALGQQTRAATKPSPPLLPGPATTATCDPGGWRAATRSATARPAFSISSMPGTPPAIVRRSASAISAVVSSSIIA